MMLIWNSGIVLTFTLSLAISVAATYLVRALARRYGFVATPKIDRWHKKPTAMYGGAAIFLTTVLIYLFFVPHTPQSWVVLGGSSLLFFVGLVDDFLHIKPYQKLIGQFIGTSIIVGYGLVLPWTDYQVVNIAITTFWLIGITNAINLLDNMDGLAAGISAIAAITLAIGLGSEGQSFELLLISAFVGALVGFLVFNFNPASIFMGDCGSMFVGFFLASSVLLNTGGGRSRSIISVLAVPALILFVPIFDTTFVTILRKVWGRKASQGGRDHTSHRLVALGLSERSAVLMLYGFAIIAGVTAILISALQPSQSLALIGLFVIILTIVGVYLSKVKVYEEQDEISIENHAAFGFLLNLSHKRRVFEVILDAFLITLSYYAAYVLLFGPIEGTLDWDVFIKSLPILIVLKLAAFLVVGVYRGLWRYSSIRDFVTFTKGVVLGSIISILGILLLYRFQNFSRAVFIVDGMILLLAIVGSRMAFRIFRQMIPAPISADGRKVLIYGAGDGGELILRELRNNPEWNYAPVGFLDDDPLKKDKLIHGLKVYGGNGSLEKICRDYDIEEILLAYRDISPDRLGVVREICTAAEVSLKRAYLKIEPLDFE
jgi:UDP-GlcNAc:undecaprenyl-phosphate/decaprenyl-phosphate GlcNAc-1-phosphate transferase